jgi:uncharacterized protein (TIGR02391 family)
MKKTRGRRSKKVRPAKQVNQAAMRITEGRQSIIDELAELLCAIAPATTLGSGFCVQKVAERAGLKKCWKPGSNKKKTVARFLANVFRKFPRKPKKVVLAIVKGGVEWSAKKGRAVSRDEVLAIAAKMDQLGFKLTTELRKLPLPDPSRVAPPPLDLAANLERLGLHFALRDDCFRMFKDGHLNEAVRKALERFEKKIQDAIGDHASIGKDLMAKAFKRDTPAIPINDGLTGNDKSEQEGFMHLTMGAMAGMRNLYSHGDVATMPAIDALERLAFVSLLYKRVDEALKIQPSAVAANGAPQQ